MVFRLFVVNGLMAGIAGVVYTIRFASARPDGAVGMELEVIAAALFAGVSIFGGIGTMWGVASAVLFLGSIRSLLRLNDFTANQLTIVTGSLLLALGGDPGRDRPRPGADADPTRHPSRASRPHPASAAPTRTSPTRGDSHTTPMTPSSVPGTSLRHLNPSLPSKQLRRTHQCRASSRSSPRPPSPPSW